MGFDLYVNCASNGEILKSTAFSEVLNAFLQIFWQLYRTDKFFPALCWKRNSIHVLENYGFPGYYYLCLCLSFYALFLFAFSTYSVFKMWSTERAATIWFSLEWNQTLRKIFFATQIQVKNERGETNIMFSRSIFSPWLERFVKNLKLSIFVFQSCLYPNFDWK